MDFEGQQLGQKSRSLRTKNHGRFSSGTLVSSHVVTVQVKKRGFHGKLAPWPNFFWRGGSGHQCFGHKAVTQGVFLRKCRGKVWMCPGRKLVFFQVWCIFGEGKLCGRSWAKLYISASTPNGWPTFFEEIQQAKAILKETCPKVLPTAISCMSENVGGWRRPAFACSWCFLGTTQTPEKSLPRNMSGTDQWLTTVPETNSKSPLKWWFPIGISFSRGLFSDAMLVFGRGSCPALKFIFRISNGSRVIQLWTWTLLRWNISSEVNSWTCSSEDLGEISLTWIGGVWRKQRKQKDQKGSMVGFQWILMFNGLM